MANTPAKKIAKKAAAPKSTAAKKVAAKKAAAPKKAATEKVAAKKVSAKAALKKAAPKVVAKKVAAPKAAAGKAAPTKVATKKVAAKKASTVEKTAKASAAKVATTKSATVTKASESKASSDKVTAPKTAAELKKMEPGLLLAFTVAQGMYERKAENIRIMDMRKIHSASADFFVVCHADNDKKVEAIAKSAEEEVKKRLNENPLHREGFENLEWILLDYFNVVAHVFLDEKRTFYGIEQLWGDAENIEFKGK